MGHFIGFTMILFAGVTFRWCILCFSRCSDSSVLSGYKKMLGEVCLQWFRLTHPSSCWLLQEEGQLFLPSLILGPSSLEPGQYVGGYFKSIFESLWDVISQLHFSHACKHTPLQSSSIYFLNTRYMNVTCTRHSASEAESLPLRKYPAVAQRVDS